MLRWAGWWLKSVRRVDSCWGWGESMLRKLGAKGSVDGLLAVCSCMLMLC